MLKRQSFFAAAAALLLGCGIELDLENPAPPGTAPSSGAAADTSGGGTPAPVAPPGDTAPPGTTPPGSPPPGSPPPGAPPPGAAAPATHTVKLLNMAYSEATTTIKVGDTVVWQNVDSMDHTTTSDTAVWNGLLAQGGSFKFTFTNAGTFPYHCEKHKSTMKGTVIVQP